MIHGSKPAATVHSGATNLTDRGIQRHRIVWVREMDKSENKDIGNTAPTVDRIAVAECESQEAATAWLRKCAPEIIP
jgi:hypothetical protein